MQKYYAAQGISIVQNLSDKQSDKDTCLYLQRIHSHNYRHSHHHSYVDM